MQIKCYKFNLLRCMRHLIIIIEYNRDFVLIEKDNLLYTFYNVHNNVHVLIYAKNLYHISNKEGITIFFFIITSAFLPSLAPQTSFASCKR